MPPLQPFNPGQIKACCGVFACLVEKVSMILNSSDGSSVIKKIQTLAQSSTPESRLPSNMPIYNFNSTGSRKRTRDTESSPTSHQASTSRDPGCVLFWTPYTGEVSKRLWSCTVTGLHASPLTCWSTLSARKESTRGSPSRQQPRRVYSATRQRPYGKP